MNNVLYSVINLSAHWGRTKSVTPVTDPKILHVSLTESTRPPRQQVIQETLSLRCGTYSSTVQDAVLMKQQLKDLHDTENLLGLYCA